MLLTHSMAADLLNARADPLSPALVPHFGTVRNVRSSDFFVPLRQSFGFPPLPGFVVSESVLGIYFYPLPLEGQTSSSVIAKSVGRVSTVASPARNQPIRRGETAAQHAGPSLALPASDLFPALFPHSRLAKRG